MSASLFYMYMNVTSFFIIQSNIYFFGITLLTKGIGVMAPSIDIYVLFIMLNFFWKCSLVHCFIRSGLSFLQPSSPLSAFASQPTSTFTPTIPSIIPTPPTILCICLRSLTCTYIYTNYLKSHTHSPYCTCIGFIPIPRFYTGCHFLLHGCHSYWSLLYDYSVVP